MADMTAVLVHIRMYTWDTPLPLGPQSRTAQGHSWTSTDRLSYQFTVAAIIGIFAACMLHGTSNVLFSLLNISSSSEPARRRHQLKLQIDDRNGRLVEPAPKEEEDYDEAYSSSTDLDSLLSEPGIPQHPSDGPIVSCPYIPTVHFEAEVVAISWCIKYSWQCLLTHMTFR